MKWKRFLALPWYILTKLCLKTVCETHDISCTCRLTYMISKSSPSFTVQCITEILWPKMLKYIYFLKCFHVVLYFAIKRHVPLPRFPETFNMWCRSIFGTNWHRFHYCCNLWWVQPLYCINTLDYCPWYLLPVQSSFCRYNQIPALGLYLVPMKQIEEICVNELHIWIKQEL